VRDQRETIEAVGASVLAVGFSPSDALAQLSTHLTWPWPFLSDPDRRLYGRLGLGRAKRARVFNPGTLRIYAWARVRATRIPRPVEDVLQLGGDAIARDGRAVQAFRPRSPDDRAPVAVLLDALAAATRVANGPTGP